MVAQLGLAKDNRTDNEVMYSGSHAACPFAKSLPSGFSLGLLVGLLYLAAGVHPCWHRRATALLAAVPGAANG
jgi:hypothetical protein